MRAAADFVGGVLRVGLGLFSVIFGFFVGPLVFRSYWFRSWVRCFRGGSFRCRGGG